jgi:hypothetical protein
MTERVLGPRKSKRRRTRLLLLTALVASAFTVLFVASSGAVTGSPSGFESADGNMTLTTTGNTDWNCFVGSDAFQAGTPASGCAVTTGAVHVTADPTGDEITWVNGQKFDTQCPALQVGHVPNKDDYTHIAEYQEFASNGDLYFYGAATRLVANGNASGDVEFNQSSGDGTTTAGCRTAGDRLIAYDYVNGGTGLSFHILTWIDPTNLTAGDNNGKCFVKTDSPTPNGCWGANVITVSATLFDGAANQSTITAANNGISGQALAVQQFAEFGINLTDALGGGPLPCFPQQVWETRSSGSSFTSNPEDIEFVNVSTCGALEIVKMAKNHNSGDSLDHGQADVDFTVVGPSPSTASQTLTTGDDGTVCVGSLSPGSYSVTEVLPTGYRADTTSPRTVTVDSGTTCDDPTTVNFHNTPLTTITVSTNSLAGAGVTASTVKCASETTAVATPHTTTGLAPGTYTCTVEIDP